MDEALYDAISNRLRIAAKSEFKKRSFKLLNNSIFGKITENIRNHKDIKLVTSKKKYGKYLMKPNFKDGYPFSKELFTVEMVKPR